jgi:RNA polymerase sigma factor (sigma-70 family)
MELAEEEFLVSRLLSGDSCALEQLIVVYRRFVTTVLRRQTNLSPEDVEELYQRFLFHIWEDNYRRLRPWSGTRSLRFYLGAVARNLARDYARERRRSVVDWSRENAVVWRYDDHHWGTAELVRGGLAQLSARDQDLIRRRFFQEESYREIALALGITVNHVGVALLRAESRLKMILQKH